jgi:hypothetical protein
MSHHVSIGRADGGVEATQLPMQLSSGPLHATSVDMPAQHSYRSLARHVRYHVMKLDIDKPEDIQHHLSTNVFLCGL